jgi:hypothetical protein
VQDDFSRAAKTLEAFGRRPDLPPYLASYTEAWLESLKNIAPNRSTGDPLALARSLVQHGQIKNQYPADRRGLIHFIAASSLLHRFVESVSDTAARPGSPEAEALAEAYYTLGVIEGHISRSAWPPETELYLETAIRLAPESLHAKKAYLFLEEYLISAYTGSAGASIPSEIEEQLRTLQKLIEQD